MNIIYQEHSTPYYSIESINNSFPAHLHKELELTLVLSGEIDITIEEEIYHLKKGDMTITFPNQLHSTYTAENSKILLMLFDAEYTQDYLSSVLNFMPSMPKIAHEDLPDDVVYAVTKAHEYYCKCADSHIVKSYISVCISHLMQILTLTKREKNMDVDITRKLLIYIDAHFTEPINLDILAKELGVSRFHISRIFSERLHTSFSDYLNRHRVTYAQHLLSSTDASVTDIAFDAGFSSQRSFFRAFKEIIGTSPLKYRNS